MKKTLSGFIQLARAYNDITASTAESIKSMGLTVSQFGVLEALYHHKSLNNKELSNKILKAQGNLTLVIDNLVKRGLVEKEQDKNDRRAVIIKMTPSGKKLIKKHLPSHLKMLDMQMSVLSQRELATLITLCEKLTKEK